MLEGYRLPPLMFTRDEAIAVLTAEKFIEKMTDIHNVQSYKSGLDKIKSVLRFVEKDYITGIEDNIKVMGRQDVAADLPEAITQCILQSISERKVMHIVYENSEQSRSERNIEPVGCFYSQTSWYLVAFCKLKNEYRNFRIDRIKAFDISSETFSKTHLSLPAYMDKHKFESRIYEVVLSVSTTNMGILEAYKLYHGWLKDEVEGENTLLYFRIFNLDHFARWYISFADIVVIKQPDILKDKVRDLLSKISHASMI